MRGMTVGQPSAAVDFIYSGQAETFVAMWTIKLLSYGF
jgi:hypothetical protein